jgi:hypothetical protein
MSDRLPSADKKLRAFVSSRKKGICAYILRLRHLPVIPAQLDFQVTMGILERGSEAMTVERDGHKLTMKLQRVGYLNVTNGDCCEVSKEL